MRDVRTEVERLKRQEATFAAEGLLYLYTLHRVPK